MIRANFSRNVRACDGGFGTTQRHIVLPATIHNGNNNDRTTRKLIIIIARARVRFDRDGEGDTITSILVGWVRALGRGVQIISTIGKRRRHRDYENTD